MPVQERDITNQDRLADLSQVPTHGRILALDPGTKRCGVAVSDELRVTTRPLQAVAAANWKKLLSNIEQIVSDFDAKALVIGLPLATDGSESEMSVRARDMARKFGLSLKVPVFLQDERVTSHEARGRLWEQGVRVEDTPDLVDSEAAAIILADFLDRLSR